MPSYNTDLMGESWGEYVIPSVGPDSVKVRKGGMYDNSAPEVNLAIPNEEQTLENVKQVVSNTDMESRLSTEAGPPSSAPDPGSGGGSSGGSSGGGSSEPEPEPSFRIDVFERPDDPLPYESDYPQPGLSGWSDDEKGVVVPVTIENTGDASGSIDVGLLGNAREHTQTFSLSPGETETRDFYAHIPDPGGSASYDIASFGDLPLNNRQDFSLSRQSPSPDLSVSGVGAPDQIGYNEEFSANVAVTNDGDADGSGEVSIEEATADVEVPGNETRTVTVSEIPPPSSPGESSYTVEGPGGSTESFTVSMQPSPANFEITNIETPGEIDPTEYDLV